MLLKSSPQSKDNPNRHYLEQDDPKTPPLHASSEKKLQNVINRVHAKPHIKRSQLSQSK